MQCQGYQKGLQAENRFCAIIFLFSKFNLNVGHFRILRRKASSKTFRLSDRMTYILKVINTNTAGTIVLVQIFSLSLKAYNYFVISLSMTLLWYAEITTVKA